MQRESGQQGRGDIVAQHGLTKYLRFIRVKHIQASTGDELATLLRKWFLARTEQGPVDDTTTLSEPVDLSEDRELLDWRYQVGTGQIVVENPDGTTSTTTGEVHHIVLFYAE
jgi:hypothetical protein